MDSSENSCSFASLVDRAEGRNRMVAAAAIAERLRDLASGRIDWTRSSTGAKAHLRSDRLVLFFWLNEAGLYFRIECRYSGRPLMSGYVDLRQYGKHDEGRLQIMSWRRGWERSLFGTFSCGLQRFGPVGSVVECGQPETVH